MEEQSDQPSDNFTLDKNKWAEKLNAVLFEEIPSPETVRKIHQFDEKEDFGSRLFEVFETSLHHGDPSLLSRYLNWAETTFQSRDISRDYLEDIFQQLYRLADETIEGPDHLVKDHLDKVELRWKGKTEEQQSFIDEDKYLGPLARKYFDAILDADRQQAFQLILDAVEKEGEDVKDIYLHVFQVVQYEVGRLWQLNEISVAQEHFTTAVTQMSMSKLYPHIFATQKNGYRMVGASLGDELHEIGIRMVTDFFEMDGWDTYYVGANQPADDLMNELKDKQPHLLALSVTMTSNLPKLESIIKKIRNDRVLNEMKILVGGYPFSSSKDLWEKIGADGNAGDAQEAIRLANQLIDDKS